MLNLPPKTEDFTGSLTREHKLRIYLLSFIFLVLGILGILNLSSNIFLFNTEIVVMLVFSSVLLLIDILPIFVKTIKFGSFEIEIRQAQQQQEFIYEFQRRLTELEKSMNQSMPDNLLVSQFEKAARDFEEGSRSERSLAETELIFTGIRLGKGFLLSKLTKGKWGERAGSAAALGLLNDPSTLDELIKALQDESSFVRYRAVISIKRMIKSFNSKQLKSVLISLKRTIKSERNTRTINLIEDTICALENFNKNY